MPALSDKRFYLVQTELKRLYSRVVSQGRIALTNRDILELFVKPEHRDAVMQARELFRSRSSHFGAAVEVDGHKLQIGFTQKDRADDPTFPHPHYMGEYVDTEVPAFEQVTRWVRWRTRVAHDFSLANSVLSHLNQACANVGQLRFYYEPVIALAAQSEELQDFADKHRDFRVPSKMVSLPLPLLEAAANSAKPITLAMLLPKDIAPADANDTVQIGVNWVNLAHGVDWDGGVLPRLPPV